MVYFAAQVRTGKEMDVARSIERRVDPSLAGAFSPTRVLQIRKGGKTKKEERPVFPGYVFISAPGDSLPTDAYWLIKRVDGFGRFLPSNADRKPLSGRDLGLLSHFMSFGRRADISKVSFDENDRIVVLEGPLKGLEGSIIKVDRRKGRVKVRLAMCADSFAVDLGAEFVERLSRGSDDQHGSA